MGLVTWFNFQDNPRWTGGLLRARRHAQAVLRPLRRRRPRRTPRRAGFGPVSEPGRLGQVQAYYDRLAPRLVAVESRNWHLQSRMALVLETIDRYASRRRRTRPGRRLRHGVPARAPRRARLLRHRRRPLAGVGGARARRLAEIGAADRLSAVVGSAYEPPEGPFDLIVPDRRAGAPRGPARLPGGPARAARARTAWWWSRRPTGAACPGRAAGSPSAGCPASG